MHCTTKVKRYGAPHNMAEAPGLRLGNSAFLGSGTGRFPGPPVRRTSLSQGFPVTSVFRKRGGVCDQRHGTKVHALRSRRSATLLESPCPCGACGLLPDGNGGRREAAQEDAGGAQREVVLQVRVEVRIQVEAVLQYQDRCRCGPRRWSLALRLRRHHRGREYRQGPVRRKFGRPATSCLSHQDHDALPPVRAAGGRKSSPRQQVGGIREGGVAAALQARHEARPEH